MATTTQATEYVDPTDTKLSTSCLDFLLIELVPMAFRITHDLAAREEAWIHGSSSTSKPNRASGLSAADTDTGSVGGTTGGGGQVTGTVDEDEAREAVFHRLESLGYRVGLGIVERSASSCLAYLYLSTDMAPFRFSRSSPRPNTPLDAIKFLCKDLWTLLFKKQIDNLKTNHRGIYVLTDNAFKPLSRMSFDTKKFPNAVNTDGTVGESSSLARVQPFLFFPAGVIRGCLSALGIQATVQAESSGVPQATFQIRTVGAKP
jgi:trafficking protein particle complex subunit 6